MPGFELEYISTRYWKTKTLKVFFEHPFSECDNTSVSIYDFKEKATRFIV